MIIDDTATGIYNVLKAGTSLTAMLSGTTAIYHLQAPDGATLPYIVYNHQGGGPENANLSNLENNVWWIRAYSVTSAKNAAQIFTQADLLLHRKNITIGSAKTFECVREQNIALVENPPTGKPIFTCGGIYRIRTTNT